MEGINLVAASKRISRLRIHIGNDSFVSDVMWCRTAYSEYEHWDMKNHRHSFYELHFALNGASSFLLSNRFSIRLEKGAFIIIPPNEMHMHTEVSSDFSKFIMAFHITPDTEHADGLFIRQSFNIIDLRQTYAGTERMNGYIRDILESAFKKQQALPTIVANYLSLLLVEAAKQIYPQYQESAQNRKIFEADAYIDSVRSFIADNITGGITSKVVAQQVNMSEKQLNRLLKINLNTSIAMMIEEEKLSCLRSLLAMGMSLQEVADKAGFSNVYNMSRFFKRLEGMSPGRYRSSFEK